MVSKYQSREPHGPRSKQVTVSKLRCPHCGELIEPGEGVVVVVEGKEEWITHTMWVHESEE